MTLPELNEYLMQRNRAERVQKALLLLSLHVVTGAPILRLARIPMNLSLSCGGYAQEAAFQHFSVSAF
jgi:hypothetical protein